MIEIKRKEDCCGCNACGDICPKQCITFETDFEGFWYPIVNKKECIDCHLCEKSCPIINVNDLKKNDIPQSICYAAENKNIEVVFDSTSGGLFSALATYMYKQNGFVGGAIFTEDLSVKHFISNKKEDLPQLRSSKYLQSNLENFFNSVKQLLKDGEKVLVCGTPCQMVALRSFLGINYDNLIIVDFICRGINSPKVWHRYLDTFEERYGSPVVYAKAKSKEYGWHNLTQKVILKNGQAYYETRNESNFTKGYINTGAYCRPSCYECKFKDFPRISDITLADFWGVEKLKQGFDKDLGTSLVMINSNKGAEYFEKIKNKINFIQVPFNSILAENPSLLRPLELKVNREQFFKDLKEKSFLEVTKKYIHEKKSIKRKMKNLLKFAYRVILETQLQPASLYKTIKYSGIKNLFSCKGLIFSPYTCVNFSKKAKININGICSIGHKNHFKKSRLETRFLLQDGAIFNVEGNNIISYGSNIEVFKNAVFTMKGGNKLSHAGSNIGFTVSCMNNIEIGYDVQIGRNVTIRDNNGNHYMNLQGYKNEKAVIIKDKAWLCEQCLIMLGVTIGEGAIVGARSVVTSNVKKNSLVSGNPAQIVYEDVLWKY